MRNAGDRDWIRLIRERTSAGTMLSDVVAAELAEHLEDTYTHAIRSGATDAQALKAAIAALDHVRLDELICRPRTTLESSRLIDRIVPEPAPLLSDLGFDLRYALRSARRQPAFSLSVIAILAVGIGAATAAFSVINTVLWRALPYPDANQLVVLKHVTPAGEGRSHAAADWRDYAAQHADILDLAAYASWPMNLTGMGDPERLRSVIVSGNFFDVIGQPAAVGRATKLADDAPAAAAAVVISHGFWQRRFGGDQSAVGRSVVLNGRAATIVGVMPTDFAIPDPHVDVWMPMGLPPAVLDDRASEWLSLVGRLRRGVDVHRAQSQLETTSVALAARFPETNADERVIARALLDEMVGGVRRALWLGLLAVAFVLLGGCANAANLMIARATLRHDEIAIRSALGAEPLRIARQLLVESVMLAAAGAVLGVGAAIAFDRVFVALAAGRVPRIEHLHCDGAALVVAMSVAIASSLIVGGGAAWILIQRQGRGEPRNGGRATRSTRVAALMLAGQVAFALILMAGAALVARAYIGTRAIDPGFDVSDTLTMQITLPRSRYATAAAHAQFADRVIRELSIVPGVTSAGVVSDLPFVGNALHFQVRSDTMTGDGEPMTVRPADEGFFKTLRLTPVAGRVFSAQDHRNGAPVAILNRSAARRLAGREQVGGRVVIAGELPRTVIGVVGDIRHGGLHADEGPVVYVPFPQNTFDFLNWMGIVVRGTNMASAMVGARAALARVDRDQPLSAVRTMSAYVDEQMAPYRFSALLVFVLAMAALILAATGVYGLTAFIVGRRTRELGIRLALGATRWRVIRLVLRQILIVVALGSGIGLATAALTNTLLQTVLADAPTLAANAGALASGWLLLIAIVAIAAVFPALRAARIDPRSALQAD